MRKASTLRGYASINEDRLLRKTVIELIIYIIFILSVTFGKYVESGRTS